MTTIDRQSAFSGRREVAERLRFDAARLEDYLSAHVAGFAGPIVVSQFKGGQSNPTYLVETQPLGDLSRAGKGALAVDRGHARILEHDPEKWIPVFGKDHAQISYFALKNSSNARAVAAGFSSGT